ncbi:MAG: hypothetical protein WC028_05875 [Candidatus Obscuribacterales bacterium]
MKKLAKTDDAINRGQNAKGSEIRGCTCVNQYQDAQNGKGMRLMNVCKDGGLRCTVCAAKHAK